MGKILVEDAPGLGRRIYRVSVGDTIQNVPENLMPDIRGDIQKVEISKQDTNNEDESNKKTSEA